MLSEYGKVTQCYQMLNESIKVFQLVRLTKYSKERNARRTRQSIRKACKKNNINEIYLIAHAFLESGYGTSNFASGRYGAYNYFGIGAFDNDPDYAMKFAKKKVGQLQQKQSWAVLAS